ncbi:heavy-metal-associated domain-containing protein [Arthrobacter sp. UYCu712]|uniref:heavy-metal-associated domain-containing protein n=1 Tax=Arthrobacter sp. UYCu712 TaxID=3156340 RepID=UPI00339A19A1
MNAAGRLGAYAAGLAVVFTGAFAAAGAVVPDQAVTAWARSAEDSSGGHAGAGHSAPAVGAVAGSPVKGVTAERDGYLLGGISAPAAIGTAGELAFTITGPEGSPVTQFETSHEKQVHLIVVRSDGSHYRHVHPVMDEAGRWSLPWQWEAAGTYRIYADVVPAGAGEGVTLTRTVDVAGAFDPAAPEMSVKDEVHGFQVSLNGGLKAGSASALTVGISRDGQPVTSLQPYLGAYGHLVALRAGDLAYLHTHPEGAEPVNGEVSGPEVKFATTAPTPGRYYLYFDFQVDGQVHSARFVLDTTGSAPVPTPASEPSATVTPGSTPTDSAADDGHGDH